MVTKYLEKDKPLMIPIAHGEGRYYADTKTISELVKNDQILFTYCSKEGLVDDVSNPNGSVNNIAGVCNKNRNVFGMMPHPERASDTELANTDGKLIIDSILKSLQSK